MWISPHHLLLLPRYVERIDGRINKRDGKGIWEKEDQGN
jgi:hypothetical protein